MAEQDEQRISVDPNLVAEAYERKLTQANKEIVMLEALVNQQNQQLFMQGQQIVQLSAALEAANPDPIPDGATTPPPVPLRAVPAGVDGSPAPETDVLDPPNPLLDPESVPAVP